MNSNNNRPQNPNPGQRRPNPNPNNKNRAVQPAASPGKPKNMQNMPNKTVRNANVPDEFQRERTAVFNQVAHEKKQARQDGAYNIKGRNIKSNRQKFVSTDDNISVKRNSKKGRQKDESEIIEKRGGGILSGIIKAILYIIGIFTVSIILAYNIIMITNDVFAFIKDEFSVEITLPDNANIDNISALLAENGLIRYPAIFRIYAGLRGRNSEWEFQSGETFTLYSDMGYDQFIRTLRRRPPPREVVRLSFPEGFTIDQIIDRLVEHGIGTRSRYEYVINNVRFEHDFLQPLYESELSPDRRFVLEGYLFPDTYEFWSDETEISVISRFLDNFGRRFDIRSFERLRILNMTLDELVTLASIIEREARHSEDFSKVSAVFHNRLQNPASFPFLESDATILYDRTLFPYHRDVTRADLDVDVPFNTYTRPGLPPSAIANPGMEAIHAALEPNEDYLGIYFFFVSSRVDGTKRYGRTLAEHHANINAMNAHDAALLQE